MSSPAIKKRLERALASAEKEILLQDRIVIDAETLGLDNFIVVDPETSRIKVVHIALDVVSKRETETLETFAGLRVDIWQRKAGKIGFRKTKTKSCQESISPGQSGTRVPD